MAGSLLMLTTTGVGSLAQDESGAPAGEVDVAAFGQLVEAYKAGYPPEFQGPTEPAAAPEGIKLALIPCSASLTGCLHPAESAAKAAEVLGWEATQYDGGGNPRQQNTMILNAVSAGSDVIITVSVDGSLVQQGLAAAKEAGIPVISISNGQGSPNPVYTPPEGQVGYDVDVSVDYMALGRAAADWLIAESGGTGHFLIMGDKEFPSVELTQVGLLEELAKCTTCTVDPVVYFTASQLPTEVANMTVNYLQTHPDIKYMWSPYDPAAAAQVPAIKQAGLDVELISVVAAPQNLDFIAQGNVQAADLAEGNDYLGWAGVDQAIRLLNGQPLAEPHGEGTPYALLDKTNLPEGGVWTTPFDYQSAFKKLWGVE
jgi:ribose transport system substrate-binding protein